MEINPKELYEELLGPEKDSNENHYRVSDRLIGLVIDACDIIAERVNSQCGDEQIRWLLENGFTVEEIKEYVGRER